MEVVKEAALRIFAGCGVTDVKEEKKGNEMSGADLLVEERSLPAWAGEDDQPMSDADLEDRFGVVELW